MKKILFTACALLSCSLAQAANYRCESQSDGFTLAEHPVIFLEYSADTNTYTLLDSTGTEVTILELAPGFKAPLWAGSGMYFQPSRAEAQAYGSAFACKEVATEDQASASEK